MSPKHAEMLKLFEIACVLALTSFIHPLIDADFFINDLSIKTLRSCFCDLIQ